MAKHILGQFFYQMLVICSMLFVGTRFLYEADEEIQNEHGWVIDGYDFDEDEHGKSRHYTYLFNVFVMMTIFNFMNARKLRDEINIFKGVSQSYLFFAIVFIILIFQVRLSYFRPQ